jgi:hypothetical protein
VHPAVRRLIDRDFDAPRRTFTGVIISILLAMTWQLAVPEQQDWERLVGLALLGGVVIMSLGAAGADRRLTHVAVGLLLALVGIGILALIGFGGLGGHILPRSLTLFLALIAPVSIVIGLIGEVRDDKRLTFQTVLAGISLYLLIGMAFAFAYDLIQDVSDDPFFAATFDATQGTFGNQNDFLYFSLATLTTTGYGDFTAAGELGRTFSVLEALVGQIYLVTVVALLVSNLRRPSREERQEMEVRRAEMKRARKAMRRRD